jgi:hypothetical protein
MNTDEHGLESPTLKPQPHKTEINAESGDPQRNYRGIREIRGKKVVQMHKKFAQAAETLRDSSTDC